MTVVVESFETGLAGGSSATDVTVNKPASVSSGDLLMILVSNGDATAVDTFPALTGFTKRFEYGTGVSDNHIAVYTRIADTTEGASETITWDGGAASGAAWYLRITGHHATTYWDNEGTAVFDASGTSIAVTGLTPSVDDALVFSYCGWDGVADSFTGVSGTNWPSSVPANQDLQDGGVGFAAILAGWVTQLQTTAAASNTCTFSVTASDGSVGVQFSIAPAVGGGGSIVPIIQATNRY